MANGLAIVEKSEEQTRAFFIDQDALECARMNAQTKKKREHEEAMQQKNKLNRHKAEREKSRRKAYTVKTIKHIIFSCVLSGGVIAAGIAGLIHPIIYIPVAVFALCTACLRLGLWLGKRGFNNGK